MRYKVEVRDDRRDYQIECSAVYDGTYDQRTAGAFLRAQTKVENILENDPIVERTWWVHDSTGVIALGVQTKGGVYTEGRRIDTDFLVDEWQQIAERYLSDVLRKMYELKAMLKALDSREEGD